MKKIIFIMLIILITAMTLIVSCNPNKTTNVYVAGNEDGVAKYWKNGEEVALTDGITSAGANSIFVDNGDVYVAGNEDGVAKYWKNGEEVALTDGTNDAQAYSIFADNGDVYVAGNEDGVAKYWKNGEEVTLNAGKYSDRAYSIFADNGDVYVAGAGSVANVNNLPVFSWKAVYWKNGEDETLTDGIIEAQAYSIFADNGDVYVAGNEGSVAKYWKNGEEVALTDGTNDAQAYSIFVVYE